MFALLKEYVLLKLYHFLFNFNLKDSQNFSIEGLAIENQSIFKT